MKKHYVLSLLSVMGGLVISNNLVAYEQLVVNTTNEETVVRINYSACGHQEKSIAPGGHHMFKKSGIQAGCCIRNILVNNKKFSKVRSTIRTRRRTTACQNNVIAILRYPTGKKEFAIDVKPHGWTKINVNKSLEQLKAIYPGKIN